jgi:polyhydroxyalkanoate synthase subunit PhaC
MSENLSNPFVAYLQAMQPQALMEQSFDFFKQMASIGTSRIAPDAKDARFRDPAWAENPFYQRWMQAYLAMSDAMEKMIPEDLPFEQRARAELAASIISSCLAPTNSLIGNPAAMKKTLETNGGNLVKGFQNFLHDVQHNGGMPEQVDHSGFEVGKNMAMTPGAIVLRTEMFELIHYTPATEKVHEIPVILIPPQIGRYYFTDLAPGRSFAEYTVAQGLNYFAVSWRNPAREQGHWSLEDYLNAVIEAVEAVLAITGAPRTNLVGFCAGGMTSGIMMAWLKAKNRDLINSVTMCVTMLDFTSDAALGAFRLPTMLSVAKAQSEAKGVLEGKELSKIFAWLRPNDLVWNYWVNNYLMGETPPAFDILAWNRDNTNLPGKLHSDFLELFEGNALVTPNAYEIAGEKIDLGRIECDSFVVGAITDHLTPWQACYKATGLISGNKTFALSNGGHIAALINPPGNPKAWHQIGAATAADAVDWQASATKVSGSWWESWTKWCSARSGEKIVAPKAQGSEEFPVICDAPGTYVRS